MYYFAFVVPPHRYSSSMLKGALPSGKHNYDSQLGSSKSFKTRLFSLPLPVSAASFLCLSWCPHVYLFLSRSSPQRAPDWRVVQGWKAQWRGIQKQTTLKYTWVDGKDTVKHTRTHTHEHAHTEVYEEPLRIITSATLDTSGKTASAHFHI